MIAGLLPAADLAINPCVAQPRGKRWIYQHVLDSQPSIAAVGQGRDRACLIMLVNASTEQELSAINARFEEAAGAG
jgi:hypothetical protein